MDVWVKCEWFNPSGSVKDRPSYWMIRDAEDSGRLKRGTKLLDSTSGNTGIALAHFGRKRGHQVAICAPENLSQERVSILRSYKAEIIFTSSLEGDDGARMKAKELAAQYPENYLYLDQYSNPMNWLSHYHGTAIEIWKQSNRTITHFVAGLGTSGTFTGCCRRLVEFNSRISRIAVQPDITLHGLEGIKDYDTAMVPPIFDPSLVDDLCRVSTEEALEMCTLFEKARGIGLGASAGAALAAAVRVARQLSYGSVVAILPDKRRDSTGVR